MSQTPSPVAGHCCSLGEPPHIDPLHPTRTRPPFQRDGWVYERLISFHGVDHTARFPKLAALAPLAHTLVLDGEVCVFDRNLVSQFHLLGDDHHGELATPPVFIAFDYLYVNGCDPRARPLRERRAALEDEIAGAELVFASMRSTATATKRGMRSSGTGGKEWSRRTTAPGTSAGARGAGSR